MPELPEVETYRRYFEETALGQTVVDLKAEDPRRQLTTDYDTLLQALKGNQFVDTHRIGKHFLINLSTGKVLVLHFGMTGDLAYYRDEEDTPRFARIVFYFQNGFRLAFIDSRKFGRVGLAASVEEYQKTKALGPDALDITSPQLQASLEKRKAPIKTLLLDQKVLAGIGNWIADEVLFQAKINPARLANTLTLPEYEHLHAAIQLVLKTAIEHEAIYQNFPKSFLIHARGWDEVVETTVAERRVCPRHQTPLEIMKVGGRTTYFCPVCQPL
ncbi:DNA-formamidopyrimidine glycosylase [Adhaeribacter pallidiroseus]|uniref:DNA-formamidopyrimidine glycosylase n=1 Tax=Adhaeribacter pallidiroseus TaxID=2072847 RepID=A0A369QA82_9BACT|nr:DNA-formamidopyrimidine glycosylase [Adhaeribacter pallidiroseus]RDC61811.1 DNA-formamidopyrimidine glycosylase [Adhaeribacter pallidiroseus]